MRLLVPIVCVLTAGLLGCAGSTVSPVAPTTLPVESSKRQSSGSLALLGESLLTVDLATLTATSEVLTERAMSANDDVYQLDVAQFMRPDTFSLRHVELDGEELVITWRVTHPFAAPSDPAAAPTATNRADLGFTGMVLFKAEEWLLEGNTFFTDVVVNQRLVTNADAYFRPAGLVSGYISFANTFPYQAIVDESGPDGSRVGISNGGIPTGNFGTNGWTSSELGADHTGWTGYGILHQGQSSERIMRINTQALNPAGTLSMRVALLAKYNDPRGGATPAAKQANRLPLKPADPSRFGYRMPHGALDVGQIRAWPESGGFIPNVASSSTLRFQVIDWDARATESTEADLQNENDLRRVAIGESGLPLLAICIPGVLGAPSDVDPWEATTLQDDDRLANGDLAAESGQPDDALFFQKSVSKPLSGGQLAGEFTGLVRVKDPEPGSLLTPLDGGTLAPLSVEQPKNTTYQLFRVRSIPKGSSWATRIGGTDTVHLTALVVAPGGESYIGGDYGDRMNFGFGQYNAIGKDDAYLAKLDPAGPLLWYRLIVGFQSVCRLHSLALAPNGDIAVGGSYSRDVTFDGLGPHPASGLDDLYLARYSSDNELRWVRSGISGGANDEGTYGVATDAGGNVLATGSAEDALNLGRGLIDIPGQQGWYAKWSASGDLLWEHRIKDNLNKAYGYAIAASASDEPVLIGRAEITDFGTGLLCAAGNVDTFLVQLHPDGEVEWAASWGGTALDAPTDLAVDQFTGDIYSAGSHTSSFYLAGELLYASGSSLNAYVVKHDREGVAQWVYRVKTGQHDYIHQVAVAPSGNVALAGMYRATFDFGGGERTPDYFDAYAVQLTAAGDWVWDSQFTGSSVEQAFGIGFDQLGHVIVAGEFKGTIDFDPGPSSALLSSASPAYYNLFIVRLQGSTGRF